MWIETQQGELFNTEAISRIALLSNDNLTRINAIIDSSPVMLGQYPDEQAGRDALAGIRHSIMKGEAFVSLAQG